MKKILGFVFVVLGAPSLFAAADSELGGQTLLKFFDARVTALGGAGTALTGDLGAASLNPAALPTVPAFQVSTQFETAAADARTGLVSLGRGGQRAGWGLTVLYFDAGGIDVSGTTLNAQKDFAGALSGGLYLTETIRFGVAGKYLKSTLAEDFDATAFAGDAGFQWDPHKKWTLGLSATNVGSDITYLTEGDPLPAQLRLGAAYHLRLENPDGPANDWGSTWYSRMNLDRNELTFLADAIADRAGDVSGALGLEWDYAHRAVFRVGGKFADQGEGITAGAGFWIQSWRVDYSFQAVGEISDRHRVTLSWFLRPFGE